MSLPPVYAMCTWLTKKGRVVLYVGFFLLGLRFQIAALRSAGPDLGPVITLIAGGLTLGAWNTRAALFAFTVAMPLLSGLEQTNFLSCASPPNLVFSASWIAIAAKELLQKCMNHYSSATIWTIFRPTFYAKTTSDKQSGEKSEGPRSLVEIDQRQPPSHAHIPFVITDILIAAVLLSFVWQFWRSRTSADLWPGFFNRAILGYGDRWYFMTSAFLWLQGLFYFQIMHERCVGGRLGNEDSKVGGMTFGTWIRPMVAVYGVTMAVFFCIQYTFNIPEGWTLAGFQAPYEDISSFGSIAVTVFILAIATWRARPRHILAINVLGCGCLLAMVVASWSRAAWLAGSVFLLLFAVLRLPRLLATGLVIITAAVVVIVDVNSERLFYTNQPYLKRLVYLVHLDHWRDREAPRLNLYTKATLMIKEHPLVGQGIGSFYCTSVNYAQPNDPISSKPDFAHNIVLQVAAEEGIPTASLFAGLIAWTLWYGSRTWLALRETRSQCAADASLVLGVTLALGTYLQTQMTANSLNVYASNQFFFWFLMAAILTTSEHDRDRSTKPLALT